MSLDASARGVAFTVEGLHFVERDEVTVIRPYPDLSAVVRRHGARRDEWVACRPVLDIDRMAREAARALRFRRRLPPAPRPGRVDPDAINEAFDAAVAAGDSSIRRGLAFAAFLAPVPRRVLATVRRFPKIQFRMLALASRGPTDAVVDLARTNPALAWMLAAAEQWHPGPLRRPLEAAIVWIPKRRREIAGWLGFPATEATVKILAKVPTAALDFEPLARLRGALRELECRKVCAYLAALDARVIAIVVDGSLRDAVKPSFLEEIAAKPPRRHDVIGTLRDALTMARELNPDGRLPRVASLDHLDELHDELVERLNARRDLDRARDLVFPPPPIPPPKVGLLLHPSRRFVVEPLTTGAMLIAEGEEMRHCIATRRAWILQGRTYCYRMLEPERASLEIFLGDTGFWDLLEIRGKCNEPVSRRTVQAVRLWLASSQRPPQRPLPWPPGAAAAMGLAA